MMRKIVFGILFLMLVFPLVSAADTVIKVKTLPNHKVSIFIYSSGSLSIDSSFLYKVSDSNGIVSIVYSAPKTKIDVRVKVETQDGTKVFNELFEEYTSGKPIYIRLDNDEINGEYVEPTTIVSENVTENETQAEENTSEIIPVSNEAVTGAVISEGGNGIFSKTIYIVVIAVVIALVIVLSVFRKKIFTRGAGSPESKPDFSPPVAKPSASGGFIPQNRLSKINVRNEETRNINAAVSGTEIEDIERKLKDAQKELHLLKNQEKIKFAEKKIEEDRRELERLKRGF